MNGIRLVNAEHLLDKTTGEALDYLETGEDFSLEGFMEDIEDLKSEFRNSYYYQAINDVLNILEKKLNELYN